MLVVVKGDAVQRVLNLFKRVQHTQPEPAPGVTTTEQRLQRRHGVKTRTPVHGRALVHNPLRVVVDGQVILPQPGGFGPLRLFRDSVEVEKPAVLGVEHPQVHALGDFKAPAPGMRNAEHALHQMRCLRFRHDGGRGAQRVLPGAEPAQARHHCFGG